MSVVEARNGKTRRPTTARWVRERMNERLGSVTLGVCCSPRTRLVTRPGSTGAGRERSTSGEVEAMTADTYFHVQMDESRSRLRNAASDCVISYTHVIHDHLVLSPVLSFGTKKC